MTSPYQQIHMPAMTLQEAAMLPAQPEGDDLTAQRAVEAPAETGYAFSRPGRLLMPRRESDFIPIQPYARTSACAACPYRRGSSAGRSVLYAAGITLPGAAGMAQTGCWIPPEAWYGGCNAYHGCCQHECCHHDGCQHGLACSGCCAACGCAHSCPCHQSHSCW